MASRHLLVYALWRSRILVRNADKHHQSRESRVHVEPPGVAIAAEVANSNPDKNLDSEEKTGSDDVAQNVGNFGDNPSKQDF